MPIEEFIRLYPMESSTCLATGMALVLGFFILFTLFAILDAIVEVFRIKHRAAVCLGFQNGTITGDCRCHGCPYAWQCYYYKPRKHSLRAWLKIKCQHEETRCHFCEKKHTCPAFGSGVLYPCPHYAKEKKP